MIRIEHLNAGYGRKEILHDLSLSFEPGKIYMLLGKNGSGKTTLLKTIMGLLPLQSGEISVDEIPLGKLSIQDRALKMALVKQEHQIPALQVKHLVLHGQFCHLSWPRSYTSKEQAIAQSAMEQTGITHLANRSLSALSSGQIQKAFLAMAIAQQSDWIFLDEPTTYLDQASQLEFMDLVAGLQKKGTSFIIVCHDLRLALEYGDYFYILDKGKVQFEGKREAFLNDQQAQALLDVEVRSGQIEGEQAWLIRKRK